MTISITLIPKILVAYINFRIKVKITPIKRIADFYLTAEVGCPIARSDHCAVILRFKIDLSKCNVKQKKVVYNFRTFNLTDMFETMKSVDFSNPLNLSQLLVNEQVDVFTNLSTTFSVETPKNYHLY